MNFDISIKVQRDVPGKSPTEGAGVVKRENKLLTIGF